jgi:hypothetical protein
MFGFDQGVTSDGQKEAMEAEGVSTDVLIDDKVDV